MTTATVVTPAIDFRYLSEPGMIAAGVTDIARCVDVMEGDPRPPGGGRLPRAGQDADSHGAMITFPAEPAHPGMTAASWPCPPTWAAASTTPA